MRALLITVGIVLAGAGGAIAYRAAFGDAPSAFVVNEASGSVSEVHHGWRVALGVLLLVGGAGLAFLAARRRAA